MATRVRQSVNHLGVEMGMEFVERALERSEGGRAIHRALEESGLRAMPERSHLFTVFSPASAEALALGVLPFVADDLTAHGGLSISQGGYAKGVRVQMARRTSIVRFTAFDFIGGRVQAEEFDTRRLMEQGARRLAEASGRIRVEPPLAEFSIRQMRSMTDLTHGALLVDDASRNIYSAREIDALRANARIVSEIAIFARGKQGGGGIGSTSSSSCFGCTCTSCSWSLAPAQEAIRIELEGAPGPR